MCNFLTKVYGNNRLTHSSTISRDKKNEGKKEMHQGFEQDPDPDPHQNSADPQPWAQLIQTSDYPTYPKDPEPDPYLWIWVLKVKKSGSGSGYPT